MAMSEKDENQRPIIIIKKVDDDHDDHHGGVWKIAFADFMTAMMAFFLVMWLINAANEATKAQVASYFNPVKLTAATPARKGVKSINESTKTTDEEVDETKEEGDGETSDGSPASPKGQAGGDSSSELALFSDPYTVLSEIAGKPRSYPAPEELVEVVAEEEDQVADQGFRDPFDPKFWQEAQEEKAKSADEPKQADAGTAAEGESKKTMLHIAPDGSVRIEAKKTDAEDTPEEPRQDARMRDQAAKGETATELKTKPRSGMDSGEMQTDQKRRGEKSGDEKKQTGTGEDEKRVTTDPDYEKLKKQLMLASKAGDEAIPGRLTISKTRKGVVVSLTDSFDAEMFRTSSARPTAAMVRLVDRLSNVLKRRSGNIVISGHTDARPFTSKTYDNWRLSTARAHAARHMLLRGGIPAARIVRVEGHADRNLKNSSKPFSSENRRIEILLVKDRT